MEERYVKMIIFMLSFILLESMDGKYSQVVTNVMIVDVSDVFYVHDIKNVKKSHFKSILDTCNVLILVVISQH